MTSLIMLFTYISLILLTLSFLVTTLHLLKPKHHHLHPPPSPPSIPVIGHLHLLAVPLHQTLARLATVHGPIFSLRFGSRPVLIVSSATVAIDECFSKHDIVFANRPVLPGGRLLTYNYTTFGSAPYGPHWRNLRRIASSLLFNQARVSAFSVVRQEETKAMVQDLFRSHGHHHGHHFTKLQVKSKFSELTLNIIMQIIAGKRYFGCGLSDQVLEEGRRLYEIVEELFFVSNASSPEEFLPFLKYLGFNGLKKRMIKVARDMDEFYQMLIDESRQRTRSEEKTTTTHIIDGLLEIQDKEGESFDDQVIKGMALQMIVGGIHTSSLTMEWALSLLLNHPEVLKTAQREIELNVGYARLLDESDLPKLPYLNNIIKETLRLFPVGPLLVPHASSADCTVGGYHVPSGTILFVNAYAIQRDPKNWDEPTMFKPERFQGAKDVSKIFFPFGLGRRSCPGDVMAMKMMCLGMGALLQCFEWARIGDKEVDLGEGAGMSMPKAEPLVVMYRPREVMVDVLSRL